MSQNLRKTRIGRDPAVFWSNPLLKQSQLEPISKLMFRWLLRAHSQRLRVHNSSGQSNLVLLPSLWQSDIRGNLLCWWLCPLPLALALTTLKTAWKQKTLSSLLSLFYPKPCIHIDKTPPRPSLLQDELHQLSEPFALEEMLQSLQHLQAFRCTFSTMCMPVRYEGAQNWRQYLCVASPVMNKRGGSPSSLCVNTVTNES